MTTLLLMLGDSAGKGFDCFDNKWCDGFSAMQVRIGVFQGNDAEKEFDGFSN